MSRDWYKDHPHAGPESDAEYYAWAQDNGLYVDAAGNVDYGPPGDRASVVADEDMIFVDDEGPNGLDSWDF